MPSLKFTQDVIDALQPTPKGRVYFWDSTTPGFGIRVSALGKRVWVAQYRVAGKCVMETIGNVSDIPTVNQARDRAIKSRLKARDGIDPMSEKRARKEAEKAAKTMTFRKCAKAYMIAHDEKWNFQHARQWALTLENYVFPVFGNIPIAAIETAMVLEAITPIWNTKTVTAVQTLRRITAILDWANVQGFRTGENPARWKGHLENLLPNPMNATQREKQRQQRNLERASYQAIRNRGLLPDLSPPEEGK